MSRRKRIKKQYETAFMACLLAVGPPPEKVSLMSVKFLNDYRAQVKEWWRDWHNNDSPPKARSQNRFCHAYMRWLHSKKLNGGWKCD